MEQLKIFGLCNLTSSLDVALKAITILKWYFMASFIHSFFTIRANETLIPCIGVFPSGCATLYCMLYIKLFLQPLFLPHTQYTLSKIQQLCLRSQRVITETSLSLCLSLSLKLVTMATGCDQHNHSRTQGYCYILRS